MTAPLDLPAGSTFDAAANDRVWTDALDQLAADWDDLSAAQRDDIRAQVEQAVAAGDPAALADVQPDSADAAATLTDAITGLLLVGAALLVIEALAQGVRIPGVPHLDDPARKRWAAGALTDWDRAALGNLVITVERQAWVDGYAHTTATTLAQGYGSAAAREALRVWGDPPPQATVAQETETAQQVAEAVDRYLAGLSKGTLQAELGGAMTMALNTGRVALLDFAPVATYHASETLDRSTCQPCKDEDGTVFPDLAAAHEAYPTGGYRDCEGRLRCRGTLIATWKLPT